MLARQPQFNFLSFIRLEDPSVRWDYNRWHQLDHLPENRALPGVIWGDRWALTAEGKQLAQGRHKDIDYVGMYWFADPVDRAIQEWTQLGEDSFQWGRGPLIPGIKRDMLAFFKPVKGYTTPQATASAEVLPMRPHTGVHIQVTQFEDAHSLATHESHHREDVELIPEILELDGVFGAWTFSYHSSQRHTSLPFDETAEMSQGALRVRITFLEGDYIEAAQSIQALESQAAPVDGATLLLSAPLKTIIPWQDWN